VNGYVSLTRFREFTPFPKRDTTESTIEDTALQTRYRSIIHAKHRALIIPSVNWGTWWQQRVQRPSGARGVSPAIRTSITSTWHNFPTLPTREIEYDRSNWVRTPFLQVNLARSPVQAPTMDSVILPLNRQYRELKVKSRGDLLVKTVPAQDQSQLRLHSFYLSEVHLLQLACTPTALATLKKPTCRSILRPIIPLDRSMPTETDNIITKTFL